MYIVYESLSSGGREYDDSTVEINASVSRVVQALLQAFGVVYLGTLEKLARISQPNISLHLMVLEFHSSNFKVLTHQQKLLFLQVFEV